MKKILSPAYSLKLKNIILFLNRGLIFFPKRSYSRRCFDVAQRCENGGWKWQPCFDVAKRCSIQRWNTQCCFNVVERCKFQCCCTQRCFNVDLTLCDVPTSYQPKNNVEPTLKCLPALVILFFVFLCFYFRKVVWKFKFSEVFYLLKRLWWLLSLKRVHPLPDNM